MIRTQNHIADKVENRKPFADWAGFVFRSFLSIRILLLSVLSTFWFPCLVKKISSDSFQAALRLFSAAGTHP
jgi:hypothetical protein